MRLTSRSRYAVAAMVEVARHHEIGPLSLKEVSLRHGISLSYLEPMFSLLRRHGLVQSTRGPGGGYSLGRNSVDISIADIIAALDEEIYASPVESKCILPSYTLTEDIWASINMKALEYLATVSLESLIPPVVDQQKPEKYKAPVASGVHSRPVASMQIQNIPNSVFAMGLLA